MVTMLIEIFSGIIGLSVVMALFGFLRQPQIPAMLAFAGIIMLTTTAVTTELDMGNLVSSSVVTGSTTNYTYQEDIEAFADWQKVIIALIGTLFILLGALMVGKN